MPNIDLGQVVGPQGPKGEKGATGPQGPQGPQGPAGEFDMDAGLAFTEAGTRANINSNESLKTILGKIKKYFTDLKPHAFKAPANNFTTTDATTAAAAPTVKQLKEDYDALNSALTVGSEQRTDDANMMSGDPNHVNFFMVSGGGATLENHFPLDGASGCLLVMNLYGQHLVQVFFATNARVFVRAIASYNTGTSSFTQWKEIS